MKKILNVMATAAVVASLAVPMSAFADTVNVVGATPSVASDYDNATTAISSILVKPDHVKITSGETFRLILPSGVKWEGQGTQYKAGTTTFNDGGTGTVKVTSVSDQVLEFQATSDVVTTGNGISIPLFVKVDGATGPLTVTLDKLDSSLTGGQYTFGYVGSGQTTTTVDSTKTFSDSGTLGSIRIDESSVGAIYNSGTTQKVTLKLPSNFSWNAGGTIQFAGGFTSAVEAVKGADNATALVATANPGEYTISAAAVNDRELTVYFDLNKLAAQPASRGTIYLNGAVVSANHDATNGDVTVSVGGDKVTSQDVVVATKADYGTTVQIDGSKADLVAGRLNDKDDLKLAKLEIKENIPGSLIQNRRVRVDLPANVKVVDYDVKSETNFAPGSIATAIGTLSGDKNYVEFNVPANLSSTTKDDIELQFYVSTKADFSGDITATVSGQAGASGSAVLGTVAAPLTVSSQAKDVKLGLKGQAIGDITVTESAKEAIKKSGDLTLKLSDGVAWSSVPTVKVTSGDLQLDTDNIAKDSSNPSILHIPVKSESVKPSTITVSGATVDVDRTVAYGALTVKVGGATVVQNDKSASGYGGFALSKAGVGTAGNLDEGEFDQSSVATVSVANVVTPIDQTSQAVSKFTIGKTAYNVNGVDKTLDVAPYTDGGRTYLPIRFVANAVGVSDDNIVWNDATKTVTLIKGDRVATFKVGQASYTVNGAVVPMDAAAQFKQNRNMIPLRYAAQALGVAISWDDATQTVTVGQ